MWNLFLWWRFGALSGYMLMLKWLGWPRHQSSGFGPRVEKMTQWVQHWYKGLSVLCRFSTFKLGKKEFNNFLKCSNAAPLVLLKVRICKNPACNLSFKYFFILPAFTNLPVPLKVVLKWTDCLLICDRLDFKGVLWKWNRAICGIWLAKP